MAARVMACCVLAVLAVVRPVPAEVVTLVANKDNTLFEIPNGGLSNGGGSHLFAGTTAFGARRRGLLAFDIARNIPSGATIRDASLGLHMSRTAAASEIVSVHRLLSDWGEAGSVAPGEEGAGASAAPGDATWVHTFFDDRFWSQTGGDFDPLLGASQVILAEGFYTWESTSNLVADVQSWLDEPTRNFGWMLRGDEEFVGTTKRFDSREHPDINRRPRLTIDYVLVPEPESLLLFVGVVGHFARSRRRRRSVDRPVRFKSVERVLGSQINRAVVDYRRGLDGLGEIV